MTRDLDVPQGLDVAQVLDVAQDLDVAQEMMPCQEQDRRRIQRGCPGMPSDIRPSPQWKERRRAGPVVPAASRLPRAPTTRRLRPAVDTVSSSLPRVLGGLDAFGAYALPLAHDSRGPAPFAVLVPPRPSVYSAQRGALAMPAPRTEIASCEVWPSLGRENLASAV